MSNPKDLNTSKTPEWTLDDLEVWNRKIFIVTGITRRVELQEDLKVKGSCLITFFLVMKRAILPEGREGTWISEERKIMK